MTDTTVRLVRKADVIKEARTGYYFDLRDRAQTVGAMTALEEVDAEVVRRNKWEQSEDGSRLICAACKSSFHMLAVMSGPAWERCPVCGSINE